MAYFTLLTTSLALLTAAGNFSLPDFLIRLVQGYTQPSNLRRTAEFFKFIAHPFSREKEEEEEEKGKLFCHYFGQYFSV